MTAHQHNAHGGTRHAFVTCIFRNDSYVPGALIQAHALRRGNTPADLVCLVTAEVTDGAVELLGELYDRVIRVPSLTVGNRDQHRPYVSQVLTRVHALRAGTDGDLGLDYDKVVVVDADILPLRCYDHLFALPTPAGILNERADYFKSKGKRRQYICDPDAMRRGRWKWHDVYRSLPHGTPIPATVTDRVRTDVSNYGVNTALMVLTPSMAEYNSIIRQLSGTDELARLTTRFRWPDMQYLTARWSGMWHNIDVCFAGLCGYPSLSVLFGTHFAGPKPWQTRHRTVASRFRRFPDFRRWYEEVLELAASNRRVARDGRMNRIVEFAEQTLGEAQETHVSEAGGRPTAPRIVLRNH